MKLHEAIKRILDEYLDEDGMKPKQSEFARTLGVSESTLSQWLSGAQPCGEAYLTKMVDHYGKGDSHSKRLQLSRLFLLRTEESLPAEADEKKWPTESLTLAKSSISEALQRLSKIEGGDSKLSGRTLADFPESFFPLAIVSGDKREDGEARITLGDFGAVAASPAEARYLMKLGLRKDVEFFTDKLFVLESHKELKKRFGEKNILVLGSPGSNHFCRRLHLATPPDPAWRRGVPLFRFNAAGWILTELEEMLAKLQGLNPKELVGRQGDPSTSRILRHNIRQLFTGGIVDPSNRPIWVRGIVLPPARDFGVLTFARNPYADDDRYVCIIAAGVHMFGTVHALGMLAEPSNFKDHPYGGVIRVDMNLGLQFGQRFDSCRPSWDDQAGEAGFASKAGYTQAEFIEGLMELRQALPPGVHITKEEIEEMSLFIKAL